MHAPATTVFRVACVGVVDQGCMDPFGGCGWRSYRAFSPASQTGGPAWVARRARHCPSCAGHVVPLWPVGSSPGRSRDRVYLLHFEPAFGHARHYLGKAASSGLLKALRGIGSGEFAELIVASWVNIDPTNEFWLHPDRLLAEAGWGGQRRRGSWPHSLLAAVVARCSRTRSSHSASRAVASPTCSCGSPWPARSSTAKVARG